jgi:hypothetical protein
MVPLHFTKKWDVYQLPNYFPRTPQLHLPTPINFYLRVNGSAKTHSKGNKLSKAETNRIYVTNV